MSEPRTESLEQENKEAVIVRSGHNENHDAPPGRDGSKREVLVFIFLLVNFGVELMSIVFGQLSSQHKHKALYLLLCLIMSIFAVLISIFELLHKLRKEWDFRKGETNWRSWLHDPPPGTGVRVGFFPCITALTCAFFQFMITTVNYSLYRKDGNAPIQVSISPTIFALGQLCSSLSSRGAKTEPEFELEPEHNFESYLELESYHFEFNSDQELQINTGIEEIILNSVGQLKSFSHLCSLSLFRHNYGPPSVPRPLPLPQSVPRLLCGALPLPESMLIERNRRRRRRKPKTKSAKPKGD